MSKKIIIYCYFVVLYFGHTVLLQAQSPEPNILQAGFSIDTSIHQITSDDLGRLVLRTDDKTLFCYDGYEIKPCRTPGKNKYKVDITNPHVRSFLYDNPNIHISSTAYYLDQFWIGTTAHGVFVLDEQNKIIHRIRPQSGLHDKHIIDLYADDWGQLWILTKKGGLYSYQKKPFGKSLKTPFGTVECIAMDEDNVLWIGTKENGLYQYTEANLFQKINYSNTGEPQNIKAIQIDNRGTIWFLDAQEGLFSYDPSKGITGYDLPILKKIRDNALQDMVIDPGDRIWIATSKQGIVLLQHDDESILNLRSYTSDNGLSQNDIQRLIKDNNQIWFITKSDGIGWIDFDHFQLHFFDHIQNNIPKEIKKMTINRDGDIAILSAESIYSKNKNTQKWVEHKIDINKAIKDIALDDKGNLWATRPSGVLLLGQDSEKKYFYPYKNTKRYAPANKIAVFQNQLFVSTDEDLYSEKIPLAEYRPPKITSLSIKLNYETIDSTKYKEHPSSTIQLKHNQNNIGFSYSGIQLAEPKAIRFSYRLVGISDKWSRPSPNTDVQFSHLPPGNYRFELKALHALAPHLSSTVAQQSFRIKPALWTDVRLKLLAVLLGLAFMYWLYKIRIKKIKQKNKEDQEALKIKNKILDLERTALQLQMNPHFIFNAMNSIKKHLRDKDTERSEMILSKFATLMRDTLEHSRKDRVTLEEEIELLENFLSIEQHSGSTPFDYDIVYREEDLDISIPPLMIQPFVENAIIHGVRKIQAQKKATIVVRFEELGQMLRVTITNSGPPYDPSKKEKTHISLASKVTQERLALIPNTRKKNIEIKNITDPQGHHIAVEVTLWLPQIS